MAGIRKQQRDSSNTRIIEAALDVFGKAGYASARLQDIAREAGVSQGLITQRFGGKEGLFNEMLSHYTDAMKKNIELKNDFSSTMLYLIKAFKSSAKNKTVFYRFMVMYFRDIDLLPKRSVSIVKSAFMDSELQAQILDAIEKKEIRKADSTALFFTFCRVVVGITESYSINKLELPSDDCYLCLIMN